MNLYIINMNLIMNNTLNMNLIMNITLNMKDISLSPIPNLTHMLYQIGWLESSRPQD